MRIAVSGHRGLPPHTQTLVERLIRAELSRHDPEDLVGVSCLADGADQIFAQAVLDHGGTLEVVIPASGYRDALPPQTWPAYDELLAKAAHIHQLDHQESTSQAHMDASRHMLQDADLLIAVWDGQPARGYGGTADVVNHARRHGIPVTIIWPDGATRD